MIYVSGNYLNIIITVAHARIRTRVQTVAEANRCPGLDEIKPSIKEEEEEDTMMVVVVVVKRGGGKEGRKEGCPSRSVATFDFKGTGPYVPLEGSLPLFRNGRRR